MLRLVTRRLTKSKPKTKIRNISLGFLIKRVSNKQNTISYILASISKFIRLPSLTKLIKTQPTNHSNFQPLRYQRLKLQLKQGSLLILALTLITFLSPILKKTFTPQIADAASLTIQSVSPNAGQTSGGNEVTIQGSGFEYGVTQVATGHSHTCALGSNGKAYCWGANYYGKLGDGTTTDRNTPVAVKPGAIPTNVTLTQITAGIFHTCALGSNGKAYCWGWNNSGQLGDGTTTQRTTPVAVKPGAIPTNVTLTQITTNSSYTCALGSNSKAYCWGG